TRSTRDWSSDVCSSDLQLEPNPWDEIEKKFTIGSRVKGRIRNMTAYGAFAELEEGIDGMIHVSDLSWTRKINHPSEVFKKGDERSEERRVGKERSCRGR